jgi:hypothetical protein
MSAYRLPVLALVIAALAIGGFGCKKKNESRLVIPKPLTVRGAATVPVTELEPPGPPRPEDADGYIPPEVLYLRQVIRNFTQVQSFRATMTVPTDAGTARGEVEFARARGLHGTLTLPTSDVPPTELYLIADHVYFRSGTSTWLDLFGTAEGVRVMEIFRSAFSLSPNTTSTFISDSARMTRVTDDPEGCKRHTFTQFVPTGERETMFICVKDNLPAIIGTVTANGPIEIRYRDYNQPVPLVHPIKNTPL